MTTITPFLWFDTQAEDAARFYVSISIDCKTQQEVDDWAKLTAGGDGAPPRPPPPPPGSAARC